MDDADNNESHGQNPTPVSLRRWRCVRTVWQPAWKVTVTGGVVTPIFITNIGRGYATHGRLEAVNPSSPCAIYCFCADSSLHVMQGKCYLGLG